MKSILILTAIVIIAGIIISLTASAIDSKKRASQPMINNNWGEYTDYSINTNRKPKINAEINESFYNEIQSYCQKNSITVSELIRRSVKSFMERN